MKLVVYVDYVEHYPETYNGIIAILSRHLAIGHRRPLLVFRFNSGDFVTDYNDCVYLADHVRKYNGLVIGSSSVDHFISDAKLQLEVK